MQKIKQFVIRHSSFVIALVLLLLPAVSLAYSLGDPLVPVCSPDPADPAKCVWGWQELLMLVNNVITFILVGLVVPIAAIMFAYGGFLLVTAGSESAGAMTKVKSIFFNTVLGLVFALAAWLIINLLLTILGWDGSWIGF